MDFTTAGHGSHLVRDQFELIPTDRNFRDLLRLAPLTWESPHGDGTNVAGSTGIENMFFVDGINTTDPYLAATSTQLPHNFVQEVQLLTGGYEAEFGRSSGGIINVVTRSGGETWTGSLFGYFNNHTLTAEQRYGVGSRASQGSNVYDVGFTLGGPLVHDRLWMFAAYDPTFSNQDVAIDRFGFFAESRRDHLFAGKLTWSPHQDARVVLSVLGDITRADRVHPGPFTAPDSLVNAGPLLNRYEDGGVSTSLVFTRDFGGQWLLEASLGYQTRSLYDGPRAGDDSARISYVTPINATQSIEIMSGGFGEWLDAASARLSAKVAATRVLARHTLKAGLEFERTTTDERSGNTSPGVVIADRNVPDDPVACRAAPFFDTCRWFTIYLDSVASKVAGRYPAAFLQDSWHLFDRLTLNLGMRWDAQYWIGTDGTVAQRITDEWQPRVGFIADLTGHGNQRLSGSFGRFYQQTALRFVATRANGEDVNGIAFMDGDPATGGQVLAGTGFVFCCAIEPTRTGLRGTNFDEFSAGYEGLFENRYRVGVRGVYRHLRDAIQPGICDDPTANPGTPDPCPAGGEAGTGNPGSGILLYLDPVQRNYRGLILSFGIENDPRFSVSATYVLSRNDGNYPGPHDQDQGNFFFPGDNRSYERERQMVNNSGPLPNDHTHALKVAGAVRLSQAFALGGFLGYQSGVPISRLSLVADLGLAPGFITPRGSEGRTPGVWNLDLRLTFAPPGDGFRPRVTLDVLNVANVRHAVSVDNMFQRAGGRDNPNWGQPKEYQAPRTVRLGMETVF